MKNYLNEDENENQGFCHQDGSFRYCYRFRSFKTIIF